MNPQAPGHALHDPRRRRMLIYAAIAGAMLLAVLITRRRSQDQTPGAQAAAVPVSNPAVDPASYYSGGTGAGGVDYGPQLATLDTDVQTLAQAVAAGQSAAQTPGPSTPGTAGTPGPDVSGLINATAGTPGPDVSGLINATVGAVSAGAAIVTNTLTQRQPGPGAPQPAKPTGRPPVGSAAGPHGATVAPYGPNKPTAPAGERAVGTGHGGWIFVPVKKNTHGPGNRR